jgi:hypothetical protein
MSAKVAVLVFAITFANAARTWATVLPDACGQDNVKFKVSNQKGQTAPAGPAADEAQIVIIENPEMDPQCVGPSCHVTVRIGLDGKWMGASHDKSYFAFSVAPGEHHLCANWQSALGSLNKLVGMASFTAEAGKVYYYQVKPVMRPTTEREPDEYRLDLTPLVEDEGKFGVKVLALSTSTPKR